MRVNHSPQINMAPKEGLSKIRQQAALNLLAWVARLISRQPKAFRAYSCPCWLYVGTLGGVQRV